MPVEKTQGDVVYAGTVNQSGALEIGAQKLGRDTTFGKIIEAVERAGSLALPFRKPQIGWQEQLTNFRFGLHIPDFSL